MWASCAIPVFPRFIAKYSINRYRGPKTNAGIGTGIKNKPSFMVGCQNMAAKITDETAPDAPRLW